MEHGWPFWDLDRTVALEPSLELEPAYSESNWRVLHTGRNDNPLRNHPFWLPEHGWRSIITKMLLPNFDASAPFDQLDFDSRSGRVMVVDGERMMRENFLWKKGLAGLKTGSSSSGT